MTRLNLEEPRNLDIDSPVFHRAGQMAISVRQPSSPWSLALGIAVIVILGIVTFATLSAGRQARADNTPKGKTTPPAAPAMTLAQAQTPAQTTTSPPLVQAAPVQATVSPSPTAAASTEPDPSTVLRAPLMVVDQSTVRTTAPAVTTTASTDKPAGSQASGSAEERFEAQVAGGGVETARATRITDLRHTVPQGTMIPAVLETAINSDLPGSVRAVVSRDVAGFDGAETLIPRGSKLIGQYRSGMAYGQSRAFVVWSRIITPDGISVDIGSPGTDTLGRGGLAGETDSHFFQRFGGSLLLSVIPVALSAALAPSNSTQVIIGSPVQASSLAQSAPQSANIPVTIKVMQGTPLQVFLVRDLDFAEVASVRAPAGR
jgi:type IV secretion system protein VirB10